MDVLSDREKWKKAHIVARGVLASGQPVRIRVASGSMRPTLRVGDTVKIVPTNYDGIKMGDIFLRSQKYRNNMMIHRCLFKLKLGKKRFLISKGDATCVYDDLPDEDMILGKAVVQEKKDQILVFRYLQYLLAPAFLLATIVYEIVETIRWR